MAEACLQDSTGSLTSFVGRAQDVAELTRLLGRHSLVTVTGPGGVGKTRLVTEAARGMAGQWPDGVWFVDLGALLGEAQVPAEVTTVLGIAQDPGRPVLEALAEALAARRLLLILDNCEHVLPAVARMCGVLLASADDLRILATSREQIGVRGEAPYRLRPLPLPASDEPEALRQSAAATLFSDRARQADPRLSLGPESAPLVARLVARLDGMPLAIELAAARVEALGLAGLADRIDDALRLLAGTDRLAAPRHRSLAAVADWSYRLLDDAGQRVFRLLAVFPGTFTLEAAEAVAGGDAGPTVLRLVDCSLLVPPQPGADQRARYAMLQTLRAYGLARLREAGEEQQALAALAAWAGEVAGQAVTGLAAGGSAEAAGLRWLDAEDATQSRALGWAADHDPPGALRLAAAQAPWLRRRGRLAEAAERLRSAIARSSPAGEDWYRAQLWLGYVLSNSNDMAGAIGCFSAIIDGRPSPYVVPALVGRAASRLSRNEDPATVDDAHRALAVARDRGDVPGEIEALTALSLAASFADDAAGVRDWAGQAQALLPGGTAADALRWHYYILAMTLTEVGEHEPAGRLCTAGLALARPADDQVSLGNLLGISATIERRRGNLAAARAHLGEAARITLRDGNHTNATRLVNECGYQCAEAGRWTDAVTLWAAYTADRVRLGILPEEPADARDRAEYRQRMRQAAAPGELREAEERGAGLPLSAALELTVMVTAQAGAESPPAGPATPLSLRERELVTLVAQGQTNAQIAAGLHISVRTVASHLDRIRDKTGCRRRADLTRLAIEQRLV